MTTFLDHLQASKILREKEVDMEKKEDAKIKIFTEYKQQLNNLRKQRVNQHMENNIQLRLKLVDRLEQQFAHVEGEHEKTFQKRFDLFLYFVLIYFYYYFLMVFIHMLFLSLFKNLFLVFL